MNNVMKTMKQKPSLHAPGRQLHLLPAVREDLATW